ncbi:hypothetical protein [Thermoactinomyces mirandus]|uniref:hypothetical protein n=1 Tax=Thermoactinomyces mirandus TaxID=2756294 RepID=UPI0015EFA0F3|nr:hypothetical protein [Thermoactinomyces mirandus]
MKEQLCPSILKNGRMGKEMFEGKLHLSFITKRQGERQWMPHDRLVDWTSAEWL